MFLQAMLALLSAAGLETGQEPAPQAQDEKRTNEEELLRNLANPLAGLATVSLNFDFDYHVGPEEEGHRSSLFLETTLPIHLGDVWSLVSRTALPLVYQEEVTPGAGNQLGIGDLTEIVYIARVQPGRFGWIWGLGPLLRAPVGSEDLLSSRKWAVGPSAALVRQNDDFTIGLIASQLWSVGGSDQRPGVNVGIYEPFITYRSEGLWNLSLRVPCAYDYQARQWTIPVALTVEKLVSFRKVPTTISFGFHYWVEVPDSAPHDLAFSFGLRFVLPK